MTLTVLLVLLGGSIIFNVFLVVERSFYKAKWHGALGTAGIWQDECKRIQEFSTVMIRELQEHHKKEMQQQAAILDKELDRLVGVQARPMHDGSKFMISFSVEHAADLMWTSPTTPYDRRKLLIDRILGVARQRLEKELPQ